MNKRMLKIGLIMVGAGLLLIACTTPTPAPTAAPTTAPEPTAVPVVVAPGPEVPYLDLWKGSAHNAVDTEPFRHWDGDDPAEVPTACAKCHTTAGYRDFVGADGSEAGKVDAAVPAKDAQGIQCVACHNPVTTFGMTSVTFPGKDDEGNAIVIDNLGDAARCMVCHQGRASKASVDAQIERFKVEDVDAVVAPIKDDKGDDVRFGFINIHYFAAAATLYGTEVKGGYEYADKIYDAKFRHVEGIDTCIGCHNPHTLEIKLETCQECHEGVASVEDLKNIRMVSSASDYDGDGDTTEGVAFEIAGLQDLLYAEIQKYAKDTAGTGIVYDGAAYPYFFADADGDGKADQGDSGAVRYNTWTARLLKAAYNYQVSVKDPGKFAHGGKYIIQLLHDSIEDLGGDVSALARNDAGHFAGNTMPFRDWDDTGTVPYRCVKCHTAEGLPNFLAAGGTTVVSFSGTTLTAGVSPLPSSNGFMCSTCHDGANFPNRYAVASVIFPSGKTVSFGGKDADGKFVADDSNLCLLCHQGRESTASVNAALRGKDVDTVDSKISFKNIHYFAAGATLFGNDAQGAYQYEGKDYLGQNTKHPLNKCKDCHDVHALDPKLETCAGCHAGAEFDAIRSPGDATDYDGDGDAAEGTHGEIETLAGALYAEIQKYAEGTGNPITYNPAAYPYFFGADGKSYAAWTPRLLKAAFNYQYSQKDPGVFVHNPKYVMQFLIDSIEDLGGDVSAYTRPEVPAP